MLDILEKAALEAGKAILDIYHAGPDVTYKVDCSPVTDADNLAEDIILGYLAMAFPDIPVVAEEQVAAGHVPDIESRPFFLVDPLDGTKEFIGRHNDFTVNIALIDKGTPIAGVVYAPALGVLYAAARGTAEKFAVTDAFTIGERIVIGCRSRGDKLTALASRSHNSRETLDYLNGAGIERLRGDRFVAEILPFGRGCGRYLSALQPDDGMGHGSRRCRLAGCRRRDADHGWQSAPLRQAQPDRGCRLRQSPFRLARESLNRAAPFDFSVSYQQRHQRFIPAVPSRLRLLPTNGETDR